MRSLAICPTLLRSEVKRQGIQVRDLAELIGYSPDTIWGWLNGKDRPSWTAVSNLAQALETETAALFRLERKFA